MRVTRSVGCRPQHEDALSGGCAVLHIPDVSRMLLNLAVAALVAFALFVLLVWWGQERMVFQPPAGFADPTPGVRRITFAGDDETPLFAYLVGDTAAARRDAGLVIHFHGNAEIAAWSIPWAEELARRSGTAVLLAEYRGYAGIPGRPTYVASAADARALWRMAQSRLGATSGRTTVHGFSLGTAVATELAAVVKPRRLVLEAPFSSARAMARRMGPLIGGPLWPLIARVRFDTRAAVAALDAPVWVAHGEDDSVVPVAMGQEVFAAANQRGELLLVPGAGHNDLRADATYWTWLTRAVGAPRE